MSSIQSFKIELSHWSKYQELDHPLSLPSQSCLSLSLGLLLDDGDVGGSDGIGPQASESSSPATSLPDPLPPPPCCSSSPPLRSPLTGIDRPVRRGGRARSGGHGQQRRRPGPGIGLLRALARIHSTSPVPRCSRTIRHTSYLSMPRAANPCRKWTQALSSRCSCAGP